MGAAADARLRKRRSQARHVAWLSGLFQTTSSHHTAGGIGASTLEQLCAQVVALVDRVKKLEALLELPQTDLTTQKGTHVKKEEKDEELPVPWAFPLAPPVISEQEPGIPTLEKEDVNGNTGMQKAEMEESTHEEATHRSDSSQHRLLRVHQPPRPPSSPSTPPATSPREFVAEDFARDLAAAMAQAPNFEALFGHLRAQGQQPEQPPQHPHHSHSRRTSQQHQGSWRSWHGTEWDWT